MDGGRSLNKNHELSTVGLSNLVAGALGGFTGSYIFSQARRPHSHPYIITQLSPLTPAMNQPPTSPI